MSKANAWLRETMRSASKPFEQQGFQLSIYANVSNGSRIPSQWEIL